MSSRETYLTPLRAWHLKAIRLQPTQAHMREWITDEFCEAIEKTLAYTAMRGGEVLACAGIADNEHIKRYAWALLAENAGAAMLRATRACLGVLSHESGPVQTHCRTDVAANGRWLALLGFKPTGQVDRMPDGRDMELWTREAGHAV